MSTDLRIFLVDDHSFFREMQARMLEMQPGLTVVGHSSTVDDALKSITLEVDLVVVDLSLGGEAKAGLGLVRKLRSRFPEMPCIVLSGKLAIDHEVESLEAGAALFVQKGNPSDLLKAIQSVFETPTGS